MNFGYFDDTNKEYVITTPQTPLPWINYLGCESFFRLISNTGGGYAFYKDAKLMRLTRYRYNNAPLDSNGHYYYIKDGSTVWNPGWQPSQTALDAYECRHGLGYTIYKGIKNELEACVTALVPIGADCELNKISLKNLSDSKKNISLYSYVEFCLWNAVEDMNNFQKNYSTGEVEVVKGDSRSCIYHKTEYRERRNHYAVYAVNAACDGFDTARESFLGTYGSPAAPQSVGNGTSCNSVADGWQPCGSFRLDITLEPHESRDFIFMLGYIENPADDKWEAPQIINKKKANELMEHFLSIKDFDNALLRLKDYWSHLLSGYTLEADDEKLCRMVNIWNQYQCMVTFNMSRSASYFESGIGRGMGFRDSCQDLLGFVHLIPDKARQRILDIASTQFENGSAYHQYQPLTKKGNADIGSGFNDDPLWLIAGTAAYLKETGDYSILDEMTPFDSNPDNQAPLMEHLRRSFHFTSTHLGPHNLPLIGRADWNDCLNLNCFSSEPGESFQTTGPSEGPVAESVFIAGMFVKYGKEFEELCERTGHTELAKEAGKAVDEMYQAVLDNGWDGEWFLRAYDAQSEKVGSKECEEGKIFIEPQGFCVMAGIGKEEGIAEKALDSVNELLETKYGIMILQPAYTRYHLELGEITSYPPGYKENAGIFCHNNPWISIAETVLGRGNRAFEVYRKICPSYIEEISDIHRTEPYVYSQMIAGADAPGFGEAKNSWLTGTAAWTFVNLSQALLGILPGYDGLIVDPCLPETFGDFKVNRHFRGADYHIEIHKPKGVQKGVRWIEVDGERINGNQIPMVNGRNEYHVIVQMG